MCGSIAIFRYDISEFLSKGNAFRDLFNRLAGYSAEHQAR